MRKIPVVANGDLSHIIGFLEINETALSDEQLRDMYVSWMWDHRQGRIVSVSLVPMLSVQGD